MRQVVIASKNPVKVQAVKQGFAKMFPNQEFSFAEVSVPSGVADQPFSNKEALQGARQRVKNTRAQMSEANFYVGIEAGVEEIKNEVEAFAWVYIESGEKSGKSRTGNFFLPKKVIELLKQGKELGEVDDIIFNYHNSKQQMGAIGILTGGAIDRAAYYTDAVVLALIPFKNDELY